MASSFAKSLLAAVVALVVGGTAMAQEQRLQEGIKLLRLGQKEEALQAFRDVIKADPSNADALKLYQSVSQDEWYMMMTEKGEIQQIAEAILERAKLERVHLSRDDNAIAALVKTACAADSSYEDRRAAVLKLCAQHGEFAVPALLERLGADDADGQIQAIAALVQIGPPAVLPLIEALKSTNALVRLNAAAALTHIGDARAAPAMARLVQADDHDNVRAVAARFLQKLNIGQKSVDLYLAQARGYLRGGIAPGSFSEVVWTMDGDKLVHRDVPALVYAAELAKAAANDAVLADPASSEAKSVLAQANLGEANLIEASAAQGDETAKTLQPMVPQFQLAALATGPDVLRMALDEGLRTGLSPVAVGAIEALGRVEERDQLASSTLLRALDSTDRRVRYAAAIALVKASGGVNVPAGDKVVDALAQAVTEESVRMIQVIGATNEVQQAAKEASSQRGIAGAVEATAIAGMQQLLRNPEVDVVVIQEILPDRLPEDVIGNIKKDPRMAHTKILVIAKDEAAAKTRFGDTIDGVVPAPVTGENLVAAVNAALKDVPVEPRNARAEVIAASASSSLLALAEGKGNVGLALGSLAAQLDRADAIAVPAARALGLSGTMAQVDALMAALGGKGSLDLKVAVADAVGMILGRADSCPPQVAEALGAVLSSDADIKVRTAVAAALGRARIDEGTKARLLNSLRKIGSTGGSEG